MFLDVDSTLSNQEGLDELACYLGKDKAICEMTEKAMSGEMTVEDAFAERIRLLSPTKQEITSFLQSHVPQINSGVASFFSLLRKRGTEYYLVSGGFLEVVMERTRDVVDRATLSRPADSLRPRGLQSLSLRFRRFLSGIRHNAMDVQEPWEVAGDPIYSGVTRMGPQCDDR